MIEVQVYFSIASDQIIRNFRAIAYRNSPDMPGGCASRGVRRLLPEGLDADVGADAESEPDS